MRYIFITGTNRGIGLEFTRQYAQTADTHVIAAARDINAKELQALAAQYPQQITLVALDVINADEIAKAVEQVKAITPSLDLIIHNAAINPYHQPGMIETISAETLRKAFEVNTIAPVMITQAFLPLLRKAQGAKIVYMSTGMGSMTQRTFPDANPYCTSKAALNMVMRGTAAEFQKDGITAISLDPGWVKTDMGGPDAMIPVDQAVKDMIGAIEGLTAENNGQFITATGQQKDW